MLARNYLALFTLLFALGCGPDGGGDGDGGSGADAASTIDAAPPCSKAEECGAGVCDPATSTCTDTLTCTDHDDCGQGGTCDEGVCRRSTTGDTCNTATNCTMNEGCVGGYCGCGGDQFLAEAVPPNVMILYDRSGSMLNNANGTPKHQIAEAAIDSLLATYGDTIRFGIALYPSDNNCGTSVIDVGVGDDTSAMISTAIDNKPPVSAALTPIGDILEEMIGYAPLADPLRDNYVLLITDGGETCSGDGEAAVMDLRNQTPEVKTFVVGFGGGVSANALNDMAEAGGTALPGGPPYYYQADDQASLEQALADIGGAVLSCTYLLDEVPESADFFIYFDDMAVPQGMTDGWEYDPTTNTVTFYGPACDALRTGAVTELVIVHNCPAEVD
jgi:hypothetical protein